jgi:hypothetical protein
VQASHGSSVIDMLVGIAHDTGCPADPNTREYPLSKLDQAIDPSINSRDISKLIIKT